MTSPRFLPSHYTPATGRDLPRGLPGHPAWASVDDVVHIPLGGTTHSGMFAIVDIVDADLISRFAWRPKPGKHTFYAGCWIRVNGARRYIAMHRLVLGAVPVGFEVDHINHNGLDNRRSNLRLVSRQQNQFNSNPVGNRTSSFKGVSFDRNANKWVARIERTEDGNRVQRGLGRFACEMDAAFAYDAAARVLFGEHAYLNFPDEVPS